MGAIFLSYAREDRACAEKIAGVLEDAGHSVWWDRRLDGGEEFGAEIEAALAEANVVLVAWSKESVRSRWVRDEASVGGDTGRLVPVTIDGSLPPMGFRQFHTLDLTGWRNSRRDERTADLLHAVERRLRGRPAPAVQKIEKRASVVSRKRLGAIVAILSLFIAVVAAVLFVRRTDNQTVATPSVALLPFAADFSDADARKLASATRDAVAHTLSQGAFAVSAIDSVAQSSGSSSDFLISGRLSSTPEKVIASVRMEETAHHVVVFSHEFEVSRDKAWDLPERVGAQVASQLSWTVPLLAIERRHPSDPAITATLLQSNWAGLQGVGELHDYESSRRLAMKDPSSPLAQDQFAFGTAFALAELPRGQRTEAIEAARRAADRMLLLAPESGDGYIDWCLLHSEQRKIECEDRLRSAMRVDPDSAFANWFLARMVLNPVGRNREASELATLSLAHDQYMPYKIGLMLRMLEVTGRTSEAAGLYQQSTRWWPQEGLIIWDRMSGMAARGDFEAVERFGNQLGGQNKPSSALVAINRKSLSGIHTACAAAKDFDAVMCMLALARLGDLDSAFSLADQLYPSRRGRTRGEEEQIWLDEPGPNPVFFLTSAGASPLRRDPRYLALAQRVGLLEYWRSGRLPDFCTGPTPEPVCLQLRRVS